MSERLTDEELARADELNAGATIQEDVDTYGFEVLVPRPGGR